MRAIYVVTMAVGLSAASLRQTVAQPEIEGPSAESTKDSPAAERTRAKLLKAKITVSFKGVSLREAMKEFAAQVDMQNDRAVLWTYAAGVDAERKVAFSCKDKPLEKVLDDLFQKLGLGYVVVSADDGPRDGWVRITRGAERGFALDAPAVASSVDDDDEKKAATRLGLAKELVEKGKPADAKALLALVVAKFPKTKAAIEAKDLLEKIGK